MDVSNVGDIIRFPFEVAGKVINLFFSYLIPILIIGGSIYFIYYLYTSGIIQRISNFIIKLKQEKKNAPINKISDNI